MGSISTDTSKFTIPKEYASQLREVPSKDNRTDAEIISLLETHVPITSEKNIWTYWHAGISAMPAWCQRNIINWHRLCGPSWTVRVLNKVPDSPNNWSKWIDAKHLPPAFVDDKMAGPYVGPHSADFLRGAALYKYGGVWMDVSIILIRSLDDICWNKLADDNSPYTVSAPLMYTQFIANHMIAGRKGDQLIKNWHDVFMALWKNRSTHEGIIADSMMAFAQHLDMSEADEANLKWEWAVEPLTVFEYVGQVLCWIRVCYVQDPESGWNGPEYWSKHFFGFDALSEDWGVEATIGFDPVPFFDILTTKVDDKTKSPEELKQANDLIWRLLTKSSMQKITHGKKLTKKDAVGVRLDSAENEGIAFETGTFFSLLRYGSVHFEQTREIPAKEIQPVKPSAILKEKLI